MTRRPWSLAAPSVAVAVAACGSGPARPIAAPIPAVVTVDAPPAAPRSSTSTVPGSRIRFASAEAACAEAAGREPAEPMLVWAVCFDPSTFGGDDDELGRWLIWPDESAVEGEGPNATVRQPWSVLWVYPEGRTLEGPRFVSSRRASAEDQTDVPELGVLQHLFDYDGDGRSELLLPVRQFEHSSEGPRRLWVLHVTTDGRIVDFTPQLKTPIWAEDVDGDGRPDLLLDPDDTVIEGSYPAHSSVLNQGWKLAHSLPDGTFSTTDSVALAYPSGE
jgi:hypothetical protein